MTAMNRANEAKQRVEQALEILRSSLDPYVTMHMRNRHGNDWHRYASRARGQDDQAKLDVYALLKTLLNSWNSLFRENEKLRKARSFISLAMDARNSVAHFSGEMRGREALRYLDAMRELSSAVGADLQAKEIEVLYDQQHATNELTSSEKPKALTLDDSETRENLRPWRDVCEPHSDVLESRFSDSEFAANLALVDQGEGNEEYVDPAAFFRITYITEGLQRVLVKAIERLAGKDGEPVIGLQTNFGGGKTHTMLAFYHLAGATEAGYKPQELAGMEPIFDAAGVETLGPVKRAVFVGTHKGAAEAMHTEGGREIRTLWGYLAWRLGGWEAVRSIADSETARTSPGSEKLIPILRDAAPCLILMDEVVAFARQLRDVEYDTFHAFVQSLTEAATAVKGVVVVASLPESGVEVGDKQGRDALHRLEKIFGRVQSAWTPASGGETFEIVRRRLFQPLDEAGEKARDNTIRAFRGLYRQNQADFPREVREAAYEEEMRRAYPLHPEVLRCFSGNWSVLDKFQRTRGILKIMANAVYALWSSESNAPLIMPALLPFHDTKVRTALLEPLDPAFGAILQSEVDGDLSLAARIEAQRPRLLKIHAATLAARAVFFSTAPYGGATRVGMTGTEIRLACAQPGDQIAIFSEALQAIASRSAHLYHHGDSYWYSPRPTLNKLADDRARDISDEQVERRIIEILREDQRTRAGFPRVHAAPDNIVDIEDHPSTALVILPPSAPHDAHAGSKSPAEIIARETIERRGGGQRRYRNALIFVAADASNIRITRENARLERAWQSILADADLKKNLTQAQADDANLRAERSRNALLQSVRGSWVQILYPMQPDKVGDSKLGSPTYIISSARLVNREGAKPIPQAVWEKVNADGTVIADMGPANLIKSLESIWPEDSPHLAIETIRDWFSSYVYLPRLRDEATFEGSLQQLIKDIAGPYVYASNIDENSGAYAGVIDGKDMLPGALASGFLVQRKAIPTKKLETNFGSELESGEGEMPVEARQRIPLSDTPLKSIEKRPKRFFASISINPKQAGLEVASLAKDLLVELTCTPESTLQLNLEIQGYAGEAGYPKDVVETVKANARDLGLDINTLGFEED